MMELLERLADLEAQAEQVRREIAQGPCKQYGHEWELLGGANAGCGNDCACSVPVYRCTKCSDCDYGANGEADEVREKCLVEKWGDA
jgi:hypothetical protein